MVVVKGGTIGLLLLALTAGRAVAGPGSTCSLYLDLEYLSEAEAVGAGKLLRVRVGFRTGAINSGTKVAIQAIRFSLQCRSGAGRFVPCITDGAVVGYGGDETITTSCPLVVWSSGHVAGPRPNEVVFTPHPPLEIFASTDYCSLEFDLQVAGPGRGGAITQMVATGVQRPDAACDNGLRAVVVSASRFRTTP